MKAAVRALAAAAALTLVAGLTVPAAAASVSQNVSQSQNGGDEIFGLGLQAFQFGNQAEAENNAFENASGNIGLNVTAGNGNQQANDVLVNANSGTFAFTGDYDQSASAEGLIVSGAEEGTIENNSFEYASGQIGANVAAGTWNQQSNAAFLASTATLSSDSTYMNQADVFTGCLVCGLNGNYLAGDLGANVAGNAFDYAHGDVEANVAAGDVNHQMNALVVANSASGPSSVDMDQFDLGHLFLIAGLNSASIDDYAFANAHGNVEANVAAGSSNQQMNYTRVTCGCGSSKTSSYQGNYASFSTIAGGNSAAIDGNAFNSAAGAIGTNVAAGDVNQQANALTVTP